MNFSSEIANSIRVIFEMLQDRGYDDEYLAPLKYVSENEVHHQNRFHIMLPTICIVYDTNQKFSRDILDYVETIERIDDKKVLFVIKASLTAAETKKIESVGRKFELFSLLELQFNKSKHYLIPKHELITDEDEIIALVSQHLLKNKSQFPHILKTDPMCKYFNALTGNIMRIHRISPTSGTCIVYRTVV